MIHLDYRDRRPIYCQIADGFRQQIRSGILRQGERMPSVRELAAEMSINPNTIQRAYRELEADGWILSVPGKGSFVAEGATDQTTQLLDRLEELTLSLTQLGLSRQQIADHILKGDNHHA